MCCTPGKHSDRSNPTRIQLQIFRGDKTFRRVYNYDTCGIIKMWGKRVTTLNDFLTAAEAATTLEVHPQTIKRLCRLSKLNGQKLNGGWVISKIELDSFASTYSETQGCSANGRTQRNRGSA